MSINFKIWLSILGAVLVSAAFAVFVYFSINPLNHDFPPDRDLLATFQDHYEVFERLRQMASEDSSMGWYFSESNLDPKLTDSRRQEYRALMIQIHHGLVVTVDYDKTVRFIFASGGLSAISAGWLKGVEYVSGDPKKKGTLLQSLDHADTLPEGVYLRQIKPYWFLVYQRTSD